MSEWDTLFLGWCELGLDPAEFHKRTPREAQLWIKGALKRIQREQNERMVLAWTTAALSRAKKMPKLEKLLTVEKPKRKPQTWQEQHALMRAWAKQHNKRFGNKGT